MILLAIGVNHNTAPLALRERLAFPLVKIKPALTEFKDVLFSYTEQNSSEAAILSTCNRTELYCATDNYKIRDVAMRWLSDYDRIPIDEIEPHVYSLQQFETVRHAFRVASGLDSMVLGETQILGQMKDAVRAASEVGLLGTYLNQLFQRTFSVAKEVRCRTNIGRQSVSIAAVIFRLAQEIFKRVLDKKVLFIGAGKMIELCVTHLSTQGMCKFVVANRTTSRSRKLAERFGGYAISLSEIPTRIHEFDIIVSCTSSILPIIKFRTIEKMMKIHRNCPILIIDLAVPRDIEVKTDELKNVFLYTIDDLSLIVQEGNASRQASIPQAEIIIEAHVKDFMKRLNTRSVIPTIRHMHVQANELRCEEVDKAQKMLERGEDPFVVLEAFSQALTKKLIHGPMNILNSANEADQEFLISLMAGFYKNRKRVDDTFFEN